MLKRSTFLRRPVGKEMAPNRPRTRSGSMSQMGPDCVKTFFLPQKPHATGDDAHRHDGLSIFLLYRIRSQPGRKLGPR
jgi:hypothetical protein